MESPLLEMRKLGVWTLKWCKSLTLVIVLTQLFPNLRLSERRGKKLVSKQPGMKTVVRRRNSSAGKYKKYHNLENSSARVCLCTNYQKKVSTSLLRWRPSPSITRVFCIKMENLDLCSPFLAFQACIESFCRSDSPTFFICSNVCTLMWCAPTYLRYVLTKVDVFT